MEIQIYLNQMNEIYQNIIEFIKDEENLMDDNIIDLFQISDMTEVNNKKQYLKQILNIILKISNNHYRTPNFFKRIEHILQSFKIEIQSYFSNLELFDIFHSNKKILLFLIHSKFLKIDNKIAKKMTEKKYKNAYYSNYFYPEIKSFLDISTRLEIEKGKDALCDEDFDLFDAKRKIGENDSYLCQMIRKDSIDEFVTFVSRTNLKLTTIVKDSIFETNLFLIKNKPSLIEYSAFFGSIQIFKYLYLNEIKLNKSLWPYVIHGNNPELVQILEDNNIISPHLYQSMLNESIKCHHNQITNYLIENFIDSNFQDDYKLFAQSIKSNNYLFYPTQLENNIAFHDLCKYKNEFLVELLLNNGNIDINSKIVLKEKFK